MKRAGWCALVALSAGCGQAPLEMVGNTGQAIAFGQPSGAEDDGVVQLWASEGSAISKCTGSLIADNLVLTARHCVAFSVDEAYSCTPSGDLTPDSMGGQVGAPFPPNTVSVRIGTHPDGSIAALGTQIFAAQGPSICRNDIALVLLDRPLSGSPILPLRLLSGVTPGDEVRLVGYGLDEASHYGVRRTLSGVRVSKVGASGFRVVGDAIAARSFATSGASGCPGDSGGPAFSKNNAVIGVFSAVTGNCTASTAQGYFTQLAPFNDELLKPAFAAAQAEPVLEVLAAAGAGGAAADGSATAAGGATSDGGSGAVAGKTRAGAPGQEPTSGAGLGDTPEYHLPRKSGGCKCRMASSAPGATDPEPFLAVMAVLLLRARRQRS